MRGDEEGGEDPVTADVVAAALREATGAAFTIEGRCPGGEVGAYFARREDGIRVVLKWVEDPESMPALEAMVRRVERLRIKGYPAPHYHEPVAFAGGVALLQERVQGAWSDDIDEPLIVAALGCNDLQAGEGKASSSWHDFVAGTLVDGADGYCLHAPLAAFSARTRAALKWIERVGRELPALPADDLVHVDFHHRNLLRTRGALAAIVDCEGMRPGDRAFDLVTFCFGFTHARGAAGLDELVWRRAATLSTPEHLEAYVAHMALRRLDWTIRHHAPAEVTTVLDVVERLRRLLCAS
jgi:hypothetical protein